MLENDRPATQAVVQHIDRCLSCLSCMTTCPSGVHYGHLVDHGRAYIEEHYKRPPMDRLMRQLLERVVPYPFVFRLALNAAAIGRPFAKLLPGKFQPLLALAPRRIPRSSPVDRPQVFPAEGERRARV